MQLDNDLASEEGTQQLEQPRPVPPAQPPLLWLPQVWRCPLLPPVPANQLSVPQTAPAWLLRRECLAHQAQGFVSQRACQL